MGIKVKIISGVRVSNGRMQAVVIDAKANCSKLGEQVSFKVLGEEETLRVPVGDILDLIEAARKGVKK